MNQKHFFLSLLTCLVSFTISANVSPQNLADSLYQRLSTMTTPADSLTVMGNLFDILPRDKSTIIGTQMVDVAERAGKPEAALESLRHLANRYLKNDSMLTELYNRTLKYSNQAGQTADNKAYIDELEETRTFIQLSRNIHQAMYADEQSRKELLHNLIRTNTLTPPSDIYDQIVILHAVCTLLARNGSGDLLSGYMDKLGELINQLPASALSLRNAYYVHAAVIYADNEQFEKSMQADLKTLDGISKLETMYKKKGRPFRNFDANRYIIYTRFLSNFPMLSFHEVEKYYNRAMKIVKKDQTAANTNKAFPAPQIYYNLAYKNYAKALAYINETIDNPKKLYNQAHQRKLLKYQIECAEALGETETLLKASREYNRLLELYLSERLDEKYKELQVMHDTYDMSRKYNNLQMDKQRSESKSVRFIMILSATAAIILLISVIVLYRLYRKNRTLVHTLDESNKALRSESENLEKSRSELLTARDIAQKANNLKTDFIKNMSYEVNAPLKAINEYCRLIVDCSDATNKKYLERFSSLVELNSELLTTIINDVLHISEIDSSSVPIHNRSTDLRALCSMVLDGVRHRLSAGVALQFDTASPTISVLTDPQRVHQILLNLLTNAAKFTAKGSITLAYTIDDDNKKVTFSVTDTGIGIKPTNKEAIFDRFVKLDRETQGAGLGLTISRMLARILGGDLNLDTSYNKGARFIFTLPMK